MKIIWFIFPPARHQASCLISSFDSVNDLNGLNGWNDLNKVEIEPRAAHPRFDGATNPVDRKPSKSKTRNRTYISASKGKGEKFRRVRQIPRVWHNGYTDDRSFLAERSFGRKINFDPGN
jgi:hypothetical protein